nr:MAG TPA: hypothetical protein [Caudoviricetes sp.]
MQLCFDTPRYSWCINFLRSLTIFVNGVLFSSAVNRVVVGSSPTWGAREKP